MRSMVEGRRTPVRRLRRRPLHRALHGPPPQAELGEDLVAPSPFELQFAAQRAVEGIGEAGEAGFHAVDAKLMRL
jgi:hypothetical protein